MMQAPGTGSERVLAVVYNDILRDARVRRITEELASRYEVHLVSVAPPGRAQDSPARFRLTELAIDHTGRAPRAKYVLFWGLFFFWALFRRFDVIHCHDVYPLPPAMLLAWVRRVRLVYDAHELVDHTRPRQTFLGRFWDRMHRLGIRRADLVITANESRARFLVEHGYEPRRAPVSIMNVGVPANPSPARAAAGRERAGFGANDFVVIYQGRVSPGRKTVELLEAFVLLPDDYRLLLVGDGPSMRDVERRRVELGLEARVRLTGYIPKDDVLEYVEASDAGVVLYDGALLNNYYCAPNKVFDYINAGIRVVGNDLPELRRLVQEPGVGVIARDATPEGLAEALIRVRKMDVPQSAFEALRSRYNWTREAEKLRAAYETLLEPRREP